MFGFRVEIQSITSNAYEFDSKIERFDHVPEELEVSPRGLLIATSEGKTSAYGMRDLEKLGSLFVPPGELVYEGMIIGESSTDKNWDVNPCKQKKLTNVRTQNVDEAIRLSPPRIFNIEEALAYIRGT